jgi:hypothetical protein
MPAKLRNKIAKTEAVLFLIAHLFFTAHLVKRQFAQPRGCESTYEIGKSKATTGDL